MRTNAATRPRSARHARPPATGRAILRPTPATFGAADARPRWSRSQPSVLLRLEGAAVAALAAFLYARSGEPWLLFAALFLAPDVAMLGYLGGDRFGARLYNLAHTFVGPLALGAYGVWDDAPLSLALAVPVALVWCAHIGVDRLFGWGLKYPDGFRDNHLRRV
ncbi:MAG TPA: DUF4260 domain-containing protein [Actinomycetota bacterium]|nr:DUF4260 domain-containing protein [Actinomycetota bacterium]